MEKVKGTLKSRVRKGVATYLSSVGYDDSFVKSVLHCVAIKPACDFEIENGVLTLSYPSGAKRSVDILERVNLALHYRQSGSIARYAL